MKAWGGVILPSPPVQGADFLASGAGGASPDKEFPSMTVWQFPETRPLHPSALSAPWLGGGGMRVVPLDVGLSQIIFGGEGVFIGLGGVFLKKRGCKIVEF